MASITAPGTVGLGNTHLGPQFAPSPWLCVVWLSVLCGAMYPLLPLSVASVSIVATILVSPVPGFILRCFSFYP
jgi:hypothetical protein